MLRRLLLLPLLCLLVGCASTPPVAPAPVGDPATIVILTDGQIELGVWPAGGGRAVIYRPVDGPNMLLSDPAQWTATTGIHDDRDDGLAELARYPDDTRVLIHDPRRDASRGQGAPGPAGGWAGYHGHITWVSPQRDWWRRVSYEPPRERPPNWPPDPWLIFGAYTVQSQTADSLVLLGQPSPATGLRLEKTYRLLGDSRVALTVTATNISDQTVRWALWSNTRVPGAARVFGVAHEPEAKADYRTPFGGGVFAFDVPAGEAAKIGYQPGQGGIAAYHAGHVFLKTWQPTPAEALPPTHSAAEIYTNGTVAELEFHGPYRTLAPGDSMSIHETWSLQPTSSKSPVEQATDLRGRLASE